MLPSLVVLALAVNTSQVLVYSQVVLSFGIPFALVPLWILTRRPDVMGAFANSRTSSFFLGLVATLIILLNGYLLYDLLH